MTVLFSPLTSLVVALLLAGPSTPPATGDGSIALDVPYIPQTGALCGGAAVAMVFRYWGEAHAGVEPFAALVDRRAGGIATETLVAAVQQRRWRTIQRAGSIDTLRAELAAGHPIVVLIEDRPRRYHYVVAIGADAERIVVHDPAWGPSRSMPLPELVERWRPTGFWSLAILPSIDGTSTASSQVDQQLQTDTKLEASASESSSPCNQLLATAVEEVHRRGLSEADAILEPVRARCPDSAGPLRELAGVRFAARRWRDAAILAEQALAHDRRDAYAWDVLGSSRFLQDDAAGALRAWNEIGKPRVDSVQIEGVSRTRYAVIAEAVRLPTGSLLTAETFRRAERRLEELPDQSSVRISYRPERDGFAAIGVSVVERRDHRRGLLEWSAAAARSAINRELTIAVPGITGQGEVWTASWRWWNDRPGVALSLITPHGGVLPGIWRVEGRWDAETYDFGSVRLREERAHGEIAMSDWLTADLRYELGAGFDSWDGRRRAASIGGSLERRLSADRLSVLGSATAWIPVTADPGFQAAGLRATFRSSAARTGWVRLASGGVEAVSRAAPLGLWPGAGDGHARAPLLRAHPLLAGGEISGPMFSRRLAYASAELQRWIDTQLPVRFAVAGFVDVARASRRMAGASGVPLHIDVGVGLRVKVPGQKGTLRIDAGQGARDGARAFTVGWQY